VDKLKLKEKADLLLKFHREISGFYNEYAKSVGLTLASMDVLRVIMDSVNCTQKEITNLTCLPKQTVNTIIKSFNKIGIIENPVESDVDKRNKVIYLTPEGRRYSDDIMAKLLELELAALDNLGEVQVNRLLEIIKEYNKFLRKE